MLPKITDIKIEDGLATVTISDDTLTEVLEAIVRQAYNEGYEDGQLDNIRAI